MKIRPVGAELFHADGRRQTDMTKLTVAFRIFANARNKCVFYTVWPSQQTWIISLDSINRLVLVMEMHFAFCDTETELNTIFAL